MSPLGLVAAALSFVVACTTREPVPPSSTGLRIFEHTATEVSGTFAGRDASIDFSFRLEGGRRVVIIRSADGRSLIESTLSNGIERTVYLSRATLLGPPRQALQMTGDPSALDELAELPEAGLVQPLRDALATRGVTKDLYAIAPTAGADHCVRWSWWAGCTKRDVVSRVLR